MLRIDRQNHQFERLEQRAITDAGFREREDLQRMIRSCPDAFFGEMGETLLLIGEEVRPTDFVADRIDLLAIDENGSTVVIELKRGSHKLHLLQALAYAGMVATWDRDALIAARAEFTSRGMTDAEQEIEEFLLEGIAELNQSQRVVLLAENFEYEVLVTAEWLAERHRVDIRCYRLSLSAHGGDEFLACTCTYPPPELTQVAVRRGRPAAPRPETWRDWEEALSGIQNPALVQFFREELANQRPNLLTRRRLRFTLGGKTVFSVAARRKLAYVWQSRRFRDDLAFWRTALGEAAHAEQVADGRALRFFLESEEDFRRFRDAVQNDAGGWEFTTPVVEEEPEA